MTIARALSALLGISAIALFSQGCSYLFGDPYGDYMQKAVKWANLRTELQTKADLELNNVGGIGEAESASGGTTYRYIFFQGNFADGTSRLRALGYENLDLLDFEAFNDYGALAPGADVNGDIKIGSQSYYASSLIPHLGSLANGGLLMVDIGPSTNYLLYTTTSDPTDLIHMDGYSAGWANVSSATWQISSGSDMWTLARAAQLVDGRVCLLFFLNNGSQGKAIAATFANFSTLASAFAAGNPYLMGSADANLSADMDVVTTNGSYGSPAGIDAWIIEDGIVSMTSTINNRTTFNLFPFGSGAATKSYSMTANYSYLYYFQPSGEYWYLFDYSSGRLVCLRPWWK